MASPHAFRAGSSGDPLTLRAGPGASIPSGCCLGFPGCESGVGRCWLVALGGHRGDNEVAVPIGVTGGAQPASPQGWWHRLGAHPLARIRPLGRIKNDPRVIIFVPRGDKIAQSRAPHPWDGTRGTATPLSEPEGDAPPAPASPAGDQELCQQPWPTREGFPGNVYGVPCRNTAPCVRVSACVPPPPGPPSLPRSCCPLGFVPCEARAAPLATLCPSPSHRGCWGGGKKPTRAP